MDHSAFLLLLTREYSIGILHPSWMSRVWLNCPRPTEGRCNYFPHRILRTVTYGLYKVTPKERALIAAT